MKNKSNTKRPFITSQMVNEILSGTDTNSAEPYHSCSTFMLSTNNTHFVGHNMDDDRDFIPGMVTVNKRGISKRSISWEELDPRNHLNEDTNSVYWISKYGSITCNTFGLEFIDGGMNEEGLCVNEMTLWNTVWPEDRLPKIYHHQWLQYLLDNFTTVNEVIQCLEILSISGHCQWHFFIADRKGNTAIINFHEGKKNVYQKESMPYKILCNAAYASELEKLQQFQGFGGNMDIGMQNKAIDNRFVWAAKLIQEYPYAGQTNPVSYGFDILQELDCGNNKWKFVYDITHGRIYFRTKSANKLRYVDFDSFDFSCSDTRIALDLNRELEGDVSGKFKPYTEIDNLKLIHTAWASIPIDPDVFGRDFKLLLENHLNESTRNFICKR